MSAPVMLAALGEHDAERARGDFGVLEEHLVEVAHPVEQQAVRIGGLDLDVLLHHRRDAPGFAARYGRDASVAVAGRRLGLGHADGLRQRHGARLAEGLRCHECRRAPSRCGEGW